VTLSNPISDLLNIPVPKKLWHYTNFDAFQNIVKSRRIRATEIHFFNDLKEFIHARDLANELAEQADECGPKQFPLRKTLQDTVKLTFEASAMRPGRMRVFAACFSESEDQLSQWRGYSKGTSGVSLGFDLKNLRPSPGKDTFVQLAPCVYDLKQKKELVLHALHHTIDALQGYWENRLAEGMSPSSTMVEDVKKIFVDSNLNVSADMLRIAALMKHSSFREEGEWRLVLPVHTSKEDNLENPIRFRAGATTLIPYLDAPFSFELSDSFPLVDVILGPGSDANSLDAVRLFLRTRKIDLTPRVSQVPYRPTW
jgi:hypothetical protein